MTDHGSSTTGPDESAHPPPASYSDAVTAARAGRFDLAIPALRQLLAGSPDHIEARVLLGTCLAETGDAARAEGMLRSAAALDPANIPARLRLGDLLVGLGRAEDALNEYRTVLTIDPDHPAALENVIALSGVRERVVEEVEYRATHDRPPGLRDTYRAPREG